MPAKIRGCMSLNTGLKRVAGGARKRRGRRGRWRATSRRSAAADRDGVGGRCARRWRAPAGCRRRGGCGCHRRLTDNDGGTDGLFGAPVGGVDRQVPQEEKHRSEFGSQVPGKALGVVQRWRCVNEPTEPGHESAADRCQTVLAQLAGVAAVTHGKARLQDRLHLPGPQTVRMIFLQFLASSEQVIQTGLVQRFAVAAIRHPPVAHEHPGEVGPKGRTVAASSNPRPGQMA